MNWQMFDVIEFSRCWLLVTGFWLLAASLKFAVTSDQGQGTSSQYRLALTYF
jgi:hypothetical protein